MSFLSQLFQQGIDELHKQETLLEDQSAALLGHTDKAIKDVDRAVVKLETAREGKEKAAYNLSWLAIEIQEKDGHSFKDLEQLFHQEQRNTLDKRIFNAIAVELYPRTREQVQKIVNEYEEKIRAYEQELGTLQALVDQYSNETTEQDLKELVRKYQRILVSQKDQLNDHLQRYSLSIEVR